MHTFTKCLLIALFATALCGCDEELDEFGQPIVERDPGVEPDIAHHAAFDSREGIFTLTLFLNPEASGSAEVWLYEINPFNGGSVSVVDTDGEFPVSLEPGEFERVRIHYRRSNGQCAHEINGTIYDDLSDELTVVTSPGAIPPTCTP